MDHPPEHTGDEKRHIFDNPKNVKRVIYAVYIACALSVIAEFFIHRHIETPWEDFYAFHAIYGFIAFTVLVISAKEILRRLVMRKEDYYDE